MKRTTVSVQGKKMGMQSGAAQIMEEFEFENEMKVTK